MDKLILIDAYALIFRSYYALIRKPRINSKHLNTSAILGFINTLNEIITKEQPTHIAVAFDHGLTFRHKAYPAYKAQREETPEDIRQSVPYIKQILEAYNITILQQDGYEADDIIGTVANYAEQRALTTYMLTPDKDYGQLVSPHVYMYKPRHGGGYDKLGVQDICDKYGISSPKQVIDILALMGDSADNYPGCPGVGEKTAIKLVQQFGSVEKLIDNTSEIKGKIKEKVESAIDDIKMSKFLATIKTDVPINENLDLLKMKEADTHRLDEIFTELEFNNLKQRILKNVKNSSTNQNIQLDFFSENTGNGKGDAENSQNEQDFLGDCEYKTVESQEDKSKFYDYIFTNKKIGLEILSTNHNIIEAKITGFGFSAKSGEAFYYPISENEDEATKQWEFLKTVFENEKIEIIGHDLKFVYELLKLKGIEVKAKMFDTMLAHYLLQPDQPHTLEYLSDVFLKNFQLFKEPEENKNKSTSTPPDKETIEQTVNRVCSHADANLRLSKFFEPLLVEKQAEQLFWNIEMPLVPVLADMELNGVKLDVHALQETSKTFTEQMAAYEAKIYQEAGEEFNISSPKQVGSILFDKLKIMDNPKKTRTGQYVTSEEVLQQLKTDHEIVDNILHYRGLKKLLGTYIDALPKLVNKQTGHIHTSFNQAVTVTGRLSSSDPNLQNIPVRDDEGKEIRKCFIPDDGCLWFSADYSQIELRIMAHLSGDENMIHAFKSGSDIHSATASKIWHERLEDVTPAQRKRAKQANFGIIYGITAYGLAQRMEISTKEAKQIITDYFNTFPKVYEYMEKSKEMARQKGYAETLFHRRRYLPDINSHNGTVRGFAERNAINAPIQGTEADIIKIAMIHIWQKFKEEHLKSKMILQVHDELNFSVLPEEKERVEQIVMHEMQSVVELKVPLIADAGWGKNWLEAH